MFGVLAVAAALVILVLFGLLGKQSSTANQGLSQICLLTLPVMTVSAAATLSIGFTLGSAIIAAATVLVAILAAVVTRAPNWSGTVAAAPAATGLAWACSLIVAIGFVVVLLEWAIGLIANFTTMNYKAVAIVVVVAGVAAGLGQRSRLGQARIVMIVIFVSAVLLFVGGLVAGPPNSFGDPTVSVGSPGWQENILFPIAVVIAAAANPELRRVDAKQSRRLVIAAIVMAVATALSFIGLLMLVGGAIQVPSVQLNVFVAFLPAAANAVLALIATLIAAVATARVVGLTADTVGDMRPQIAGTPSVRATRIWTGVIAGMVLIGLTIWRPSPVALIVTLAVTGVVGLVAERRAQHRSSEANSETAVVDGSQSDATESAAI